MAFISDVLATIKNAQKGRDMRQAIHDGIEQCYKDATGHPDSVAAVVDGLVTEKKERKAEVDIERKRIDVLINELPGTPGEYQQSKLVLHSYGNTAVKCTTTSGNYTNVPAFTTNQGGPLSSLYTKKSNYQIAVNKSGLYLFELRINVNSLVAYKRVELAPFINGTRNAALASTYNTAGDFALFKVVALPLWLNANDTVEFRIAPIDAAAVSLALGDVLIYAIDWEDKSKIPDYTGYTAETKDIRTGADGVVYGTAGEAVRKQIGNLKEDLVITQKAYLVNPKITNNLYVNAEGTIIGYDGWDLADIPVLGGDKIIIYSPTDSKYNAMYFANYANFKNVELKNGLNYIDIPDGYRSLVVSNEREIMKKVRFLVFPMQVINSNNEKLKKADKGKALFNKVSYTYINNVDGNEINSDTYSSSDFIELTDCKNFVIECQEDSDSNALYDENKNFIQSIEYKKGITEFEKPTNAKYLRISCHTDFLEKASVIFDSSISYRDFKRNEPYLPRKKGWESNRETIIDEAYKKLLNAYKENPDIIPIFVCTDSHRWSPQHPQRYVNNIDTDGMKIANINLGDDVTEHWDDLKFDTIYNNIRYIRNYIGVCGNHDKWDGTSTTEYFLRRIFTSEKARYIVKSKRCCYTVKDNLHNVKYIIFDPYYAPNSGVPMVSVPTVVATWFVKELSKNDGYDIIFLNHQALTDNNIHRDGTKQTWKMESYEEPIFGALFNVLKDRKNKRKGTYTDTDGIAHQYDFSRCENDLLCLLHGHSHEELYYIEDGLTSYVCDWDGAESTGYKSTFIAIDRSKETLTVWIAKGSENVEPALELKIN